MDIETAFNDLGVDAIVGSRLMGMLGLYTSDFIDPARFMRFKEIIDFFKPIPEMEYMVNRITIGKNVDKLDHVWGYTQLSKRRDDLRKHEEETKAKLDTVKDLSDEPFKVKEIENELLKYQSDLKITNDEIYAYEM
jgi:hypothetical protein